MDKNMDRYFSLAAEETMKSMDRNDGGPFGATIVKDGEIIVAVGNTQMRDTDPTAHAELLAIREACQKLGTRDLTGCDIYATCQPCPMCVGAIIWSGIKNVYYSNTAEDAAENGFSDMDLRNYLDHSDTSILNMVEVEDREDCNQLFTHFHEMNK